MTLNLPHLKTPSIFVILGATGDLAKRKIIPALWRLFEENLLPEKCLIVAFADTDFSQEDFKKYLEERLGEKAKKAEADKLNFFLSRFYYLTGKFENEKSFRELVGILKKKEGEWAICSNKVFFLAAIPSFYEVIFTNLAKVKLNIPCGGELGWTRILIEKPFGRSLKTSRQLQKLLSKNFKEEQIYRIEHYLAKELVQGITNFRFSNNLFEHSWNNSLIEKIEIRLLETIGVEERGAFYDSVGALIDVGQNHLLEMLALITMKFPISLDAETIRKSRAEILEKLKPWDKKSIVKNTYRAQYEGYLDIEGVKKKSTKETFFALKTEIEDFQWRGVPVIIEAGKKCEKAQKEIVVTMKDPEKCFHCLSGNHIQNKVIFQIEPQNQIIIKFWTRKPGFQTSLEERSFSFFLYEKEEKAPYVEEYAKLFYEAMAGDQTDFASKEEVEALWKFADPVVEAWEKNLVPLSAYKQRETPKVDFAEKEEIKIIPLMKKEIAIVGLGKMGANIARRLMERGWRVAGYDQNKALTKNLEKEGLGIAHSSDELLGKFSLPRLIWLMLPAGKAVDEFLYGKEGIVKLLSKGDIIIDGGNSFYKDSAARFKKLKEDGIYFVDAGVSGGPEGARKGTALMVGGEKKIFEKLEPLFFDLAKENGCQFFDSPGAGHFVKMIHNGIEYGMMQAIAEGFNILKKSPYRLDLKKVAEIYSNGSVIESRLVAWLKDAFEAYGDDLKKVSGKVGATGEGEWTVKTAKEMKLRAKVIEEALKFRKNSQRNPDYAGKVLSALRNQFGGHKV